MNYNRLKAETQKWTVSGIISAAQAERILALYDGEVPVYKTMRFWLQSLAITLLGFALFLVISANWQHLSWPLQSLIALLPLIAAQVWGVRNEIRDNRFGADLAWFAASIGLGANIMLQAQIFHISAYYPNGVLFWVLGMLPVVVLRPTTITYLLAAALFVTYMGMQIGYDQFGLLSVLPLAVLARYAWQRQTFINTLTLLVVIYMFINMLLAYRGLDHRGLVWEVALLTVALAIVQKFNELKERVVALFVVLFITVALFVTMLLTFNSLIGRFTADISLAVALLIMLLAVASLYMQRSELRERKLTLVLAGTLCALMSLLSVSGILGGRKDTDPRLFTRIGANLVYIVALVVVLFQAIGDREKRLFMGAAFGLLLWTWIRYLDLFSNYLVTALIFAASAGGLVVLNKMWERKYEK